jgi:hypothetical protein
MPNSRASAIVDLDIRIQNNVLSVACPNQWEEIWNIIPRESLRIKFIAEGAGEFAQLTCQKE